MPGGLQGRITLVSGNAIVFYSGAHYEYSRIRFADRRYIFWKAFPHAAVFGIGLFSFLLLEQVLAMSQLDQQEVCGALPQSCFDHLAFSSPVILTALQTHRAC
jgi:hypothetical protein